jgi:hypothetical protein
MPALAAALLSVDIPTATRSAPQAWYALSAAAQSLAAVLGLALATATVIAQLRGLFSRQSIGREVFQVETVVIVTLYAAVIAADLVAVAASQASPTTIRILLALNGLALAGLGPYLTILRTRLSPDRFLDSAATRLRRDPSPEDAMRVVASVQDFALTAVQQREYETLRRSIETLAHTISDDSLDARVERNAAERLETVALVGLDDPVAVSLTLRQLRLASDRVRGAGEDAVPTGDALGVLGVVAEVVTTIADRAMTTRKEAECAQSADLLGDIAQDLVRAGAQQELASAVGGLVKIKTRAPTLGLNSVAGRAAGYLAGIRLGATPDRPWPRRARSTPITPNLLSNASFEFGHDFGFGREPGWFQGYGGASFQMHALRLVGDDRHGQYCLRVGAGASNHSVAQDVRATPRIGESYQGIWHMASPGQQLVRGRVAVWGLGAIEERGGGGFIAGGAGGRWTYACAPFDVSQPGHTYLRGELYIDETDTHDVDQARPATTDGGVVLVDDVALVPVGLQNASFELRQLAPWRVEGAHGSAELTRHEHAPQTLNGELFVRLLPAGRPLSLRQAIAIEGDPARTYEFSAWIRAAGESPTQARLDVRRGQETISSATFDAGSEWSCVTLAFVPSAAAGGTAADEERCDCGVTVDEGAVEFDNASVVPTLLLDADFTTSRAWTVSPPDALSVVASHATRYGSATIARVTTARSVATVRQDIECLPTVGTGLRFAVRARVTPEEPGASGDTKTVGLRISALSDDSDWSEGEPTLARLSDGWEVVSVPFDCDRGDYVRVRAEIEVPPRTSLDLAGATFNPLAV